MENTAFHLKEIVLHTTQSVLQITIAVLCQKLSQSMDIPR